LTARGSGPAEDPARFKARCLNHIDAVIAFFRLV
jgi:hypothetical protein